MWWRHPERIARLVGDLVAGELAILRPGSPPGAPESADLVSEYGLDSLELVQLATRVSVALDLGASGIDDYLLARRTLADWRAIAVAGLDRASGRMTFLTSGSTGHAKSCSHLLDELAGEVEALLPLLGGARRVVALVPSHHIYGFLFTILLPARLGIEVLDARGMLGSTLLRRLAPGDLVVGFPERYAGLVTAGTPPSGVTALVSTAPCPATLHDALAAAGWERTIEIYGSSETGGLGIRSGGHQPFALIAPWRRAGDLLERPGRAPVMPPDRLDWTGADRFRPAGRHDGAVQVMGINVFPERVRAVLRTHPAIGDAAIRLAGSGGSARLKAFIVPHGEAPDEADLARWAEARLSPPERPRHWRIGPVLPTGPLGKPADWEE